MVTYDGMVFSAKLKLLMARHRYSQTKVAEAISVSQSLVSLWTLGKGVPDLHEAAKLAKFFGVELNYLADDALDEPPPSEFSGWERSVIDLVRALELEKGEVLRRLTTPPHVSVQPVEPGPISPNPYPPSGPEIPDESPPPARGIPHKRRHG